MGNTRACNAGSAATTHLYINSNRIQSNDVDRMTTAGCSCSNCGWGLGTSYDNSNGNGHTVRPRCDAQFHVDNTWGHTYAAGGQSGDVDRIPGIIGTDSYGFAGCCRFTESKRLQRRHLRTFGSVSLVQNL